ncbi:unnamed protein product [Nippostrongylus brasiliensis]|uniref:Transmembrane protein n=1 Tax=Nippostrongylus brasiliensis TaxID=27835 RepID=A0A158QX15_NIPBR|nr:unnamed protein product [Nippostrongylus brasiliensis]
MGIDSLNVVVFELYVHGRTAPLRDYLYLGNRPISLSVFWLCFENELVGTIVLKICLALIFIGSATGAIVYSVINFSLYIVNEIVDKTHLAEESQNQTPTGNATLYFPYDINQQCYNGTLTMLYRRGVQNGQQVYSYVEYGTDWVQDAMKKRLYHRVGLTPSDWQYSYYVFPNVTFFQTKQRCTRMDQTYEEFIEGLGLTYMRKNREEEVSLNGRYKEVIVYEGEPPEDVSINGRHPSLIRGYSSVQRNVTYGWELYFSHTTNFSLYKQEYWYPTMSSTEPDWNIFNDIPNECFIS